MNTSLDKSWHRMGSTISLILICAVVLNSCKEQASLKKQESPEAQVKTKIFADSISIPAENLPEFKTDPHVKESQGNQISGVVRTLLQDNSGKYWFGTQNGLCRYDGTSLIYYDIKDDLGDTITIKTIKEDKKGNIWIGHTGGITKYDGESFTNFSEKDGLISNDVWSMAIDKNGIIWIGTLQGVNRFNGEVFTPFDIPEAEPDFTRGVTSSKIVHWIMEDSKGKMWFGTNGGAYIYDGKSLSNLSETDGLCNNAVNSILEDNHGNIWFATSHNGLCRYDGTSFTIITENEIVGGKEIWTILEDNIGNIWFNVKGFGVYRYDGKTFTNFNKTNGLKSNAIMCIYEDQEGRIWCSGFGGLYRYDQKSFVNVTREGPWANYFIN